MQGAVCDAGSMDVLSAQMDSPKIIPLEPVAVDLNGAATSSSTTPRRTHALGTCLVRDTPESPDPEPEAPSGEWVPTSHDWMEAARMSANGTFGAEIVGNGGDALGELGEHERLQNLQNQHNLQDVEDVEEGDAIGLSILDDPAALTQHDAPTNGDSGSL